jgi:hypothetical protein
MEESSISYATLARAVREGGLSIAIILRYSAIPAHCACTFGCASMRWCSPRLQ